MNRTRTHDGADLAWWSTGRGDPLLLIAGQAVTHHAWGPVLDSLSQHHQVLTFDHRGIGHSTLGEPQTLTTRSLSDDAVCVLDAAGISHAHVFGHSLGGRVAQWIAIDHPHRVGGLVLGATTAGDARGQPRSPEATAALLSGDPNQLAPLFYAPGHHGDASQPRAVFTTAGAASTLRLYYRASRAHDTWNHLQSISAPTLIQHGTDDPITPPDNAQQLADAIPNAQLQLLDGLRHGYYLQSPTALTRITRHLTDHQL